MLDIPTLKKDFANTQQGYKILFPQGNIIEPQNSTQFVYVMRSDLDAVCTPLAEKLHHDYKLPHNFLKEVLERHYQDFVFNLSEILGRNFATYGETEIHLFDSNKIEKFQRNAKRDGHVISLDPLITGNNILSLGLSRCYLPGGTEEIGLTNRPGTPSLSEQISKIRGIIGTNTQVDIIEDDIYTGGSLMRIIDMLSAENIIVGRIIPGIQIGKPAKIINRGIKITPAIQYVMSEGQGIDLGDPRDFMLGADGLVTYFSKRILGRLPYIAPFVDPHARLSINKNKTAQFSQEVIKLNLDFYEGLEAEFGVAIKISHMKQNSANALTHLMPQMSDARMVDIAHYIEDNSETLEQACLAAKEFAQIERLELPAHVIFLDVNGTILPAGAQDGFIPAELQTSFKNIVEKLEHMNVAVGLNSDSPLPQLQNFAHQIGLGECPVLAENGAILSYKGRTHIFRTMENLDLIKETIVKNTIESTAVQANDIVGPEFGGGKLSEGEWAFGANRTASISVFGPSDILAEFKMKAESLDSNLHSDFSPDHNFLGIHIGNDFRKGKAETLKKIVNTGHIIASIGDSLSDYAPLSLPNRVFFVSDDLPVTITSQSHVTVTQAKGFEGVIESLKQIHASLAVHQQPDHTLRYEA